MDELLEVGSVAREELMVSPIGDGLPTKRLAHFLQPIINSNDGSVFELPLDCFSSLRATFEPKNWPLKVSFHGWRFPQKEWKTWVGKMAALHESKWKNAGIHEVILSSTYKIQRNNDLVLGLAEKWCSETKSFIFPWGEATITLEDVMIAGYSVLGSPVFSPLETGGLKEIEEKLKQARSEINRSAARKADQSTWMKKFMDSGSEIEHEAFLSLWLSRFAFPGSSYSVIGKSVFPIAVHLARGTRIALAPAILASIYRDLSSLKQTIIALTKFDNWEDMDTELTINIRAPFQLVQIWAWERFIQLRPGPNLIKTGEPRFARWHEKMVGVENVRTVLDSANEDFDWRPYVKPVINWNFPQFYGEKEMWVSADPNLSEDLQSFARCLRISELVGLDCIEQYLPHRVAMQFGMDQDLPACVARANETPYIAWNYYSRPINFANLYIPCRLYEADVTSRYSDWWKRSMSRLQAANDCVLPLKKDEAMKERSSAGVGRILKRTKGMKAGDTFSSSRTTPKRSKRNKGQHNTKKIWSYFKISDGASIHPSSSLKSSEKVSETSKWQKRDDGDFVVDGGVYMKAKKLMETSKEQKKVNDVSASVGLTLKTLPLDLKKVMEANDSLVPPGFPPKSSLVEAGNLIDDDNLTIAEFLKSSKKHDDVGSSEISKSEILLSEYQKFSSSIADNAPQTNLAVNTTVNEPMEGGSERAWEHATESKLSDPEIESAEKILQKDLVKGGLETTGENATESEASSPDHNIGRIRGGEGDGVETAIERPELQFEYRVSKLEKIVAELKAARYGHKLPVVALSSQ